MGSVTGAEDTRLWEQRRTGAASGMELLQLPILPAPCRNPGWVPVGPRAAGSIVVPELSTEGGGKGRGGADLLSAA